MDIAKWLQDLGLERYAPAFRDNDVDGEVLPELTADDLISIGVTSVGHRRQLLAAIAALGAAAPAKSPAPDDLTRGLRTPPPPEHLADKIRQARPALEGETQAHHGPVRRCKGLDEPRRTVRSRTMVPSRRGFFPGRGRRRAPLRRHGKSVHQRRDDGAVRRADHAWRSCPPGLPRRLRRGSETKPRRATNPRTLRPRDLGTPLSAMWASAAKLRMLFIVENQPGK